MTETMSAVPGARRSPAPGRAPVVGLVLMVVLHATGPGAAPGAAAPAQDVPAEAAAVRELTPEESVRLALEHDARIRAADADVAAAGARHREARAGLYPSVRAQANYTRLGGDIPETDITLPGLDTAVTILPIERDRYQAEIGLEQPLFAGGRLRRAAEAAEREADAVGLQAVQRRADVALEARTAYWTLYGALEERDAVEAALALMEEHLGDVGNRYEEGVVLQSELLAARARRSEVALQRVEVANAVRLARLELNRLVGFPPGTEVRPAAGPEAADVEPLPPDLDAFVASAVAAQPRLRARAAEVESLRAGAAAARGTRFPDVAATGRYVYARPNPFVFTEQGTFRGTWEAGLVVRWPLWEGGGREARVAEARDRLRAAEARLEVARQDAAVEFARSYLEARRATEAVAVALEAEEQAAEALRVTRAQFAEGVTLSAEVLEAERAHREARSRHARAVAERSISRAVLRHALGEVR